MQGSGRRCRALAAPLGLLETTAACVISTCFFGTSALAMEVPVEFMLITCLAAPAFDGFDGEAML